jgi:manganese efflux pump family protein
VSLQANSVQQTVTLLLVAVALGMDAMSLGFGVGMKGLRKREILKMSMTIGLFHVIMPLIGMVSGWLLHERIGDVTRIFGAVLLLFFGIQMMVQSSQHEEEKTTSHKTDGLGLVLFSMSVSIDALSVGFSLGLFEVNPILTVSLFGVVGALMAATGLSIGTKVHRILGGVGEIIGGLILVVFGVRFLFL